MIAPVTVAGILIMAVLASMSSTNQSFAYSSYKSYKQTRHGNLRASNTRNAAQGASNTGNEAQGASNTGQGGTSSQAGHCKSAITFSASWYPPYRNLMMRGKLTCGGSGLGEKTITLTSTHVSYFGKIGTAVTAPDGSFSKSYKPVSTAKPLSTVSAWYLGGPDEGGISSKVISLGPPPWSVGTQLESGNTGNTVQEKGAGNTGNTP